MQVLLLFLQKMIKAFYIINHKQLQMGAFQILELLNLNAK